MSQRLDHAGLLAVEHTMHDEMGVRRASKMMRARCRWPVCMLSLGIAVGCASDNGFVPPDGGTTSSGGGGGGSATGGTTSNPQAVVEVCTALCKAQYAGHCQRVEITTRQCPGVCSFLEAASPTCQSSTQTAFECQLENDPCKTTNCNELLKKAEDDCPEKPWVTGTQ